MQQRWLYLLMIGIGIVAVVANVWVYLLDASVTALLFAGLGVLLIVAGIVNIRRMRSGRGE
jgi:membrane protein implicated in regulation of membrane protease activity